MVFKLGKNKLMFMGYGGSNNGKVEDGQSVHSTYIMVKDLKIIRGIHHLILILKVFLLVTSLQVLLLAVMLSVCSFHTSYKSMEWRFMRSL